MKQKLVQSPKIGTLILSLSTLFLLLIGAFAPTSQWRPAPVSTRISGHNFDPAVNLGPKILSTPVGITGQPTTVTINFEYKVLTRPSDFSFLISTSTIPNGGLTVSIDKWGNIFLALESKSKSLSPYHLVKISEPHDLEKWVKIRIFIDTGLDILKIDKDDQPVGIGEARPDHVLQLSDVFLNSTSIQIGGVDGHNFMGRIKNFDMSFGRSGFHMSLINLRLFAFLGAFVPIGALIKIRKNRSAKTKITNQL